MKTIGKLSSKMSVTVETPEEDEGAARIDTVIEIEEVVIVMTGTVEIGMIVMTEDEETGTVVVGTEMIEVAGVTTEIVAEVTIEIAEEGTELVEAGAMILEAETIAIDAMMTAIVAVKQYFHILMPSLLRNT